MMNGYQLKKFPTKTKFLDNIGWIKRDHKTDDLILRVGSVSHRDILHY